MSHANYLVCVKVNPKSYEDPMTTKIDLRCNGQEKMMWREIEIKKEKVGKERIGYWRHTIALFSTYLVL